jgi:hypothetical protein
MAFGCWHVGRLGVQTGPGIAAETARWLGVMCELDEEIEAAAAPARTTVRATIRMVSFMGNILLLELKMAAQKRTACYYRMVT